MVAPPYLYDAPRRDSAMGVPTTFNPKAVTMASRQPPPPPVKKPEGPYISFNQHPDSFLILPYGKTDAKPMSSKTKTAISAVRWTQFTLRLLTLLGAFGVILCAIFVRGATDTEGYIMRIAPGVGIVFVLYAVYHLLRKPTSRPPGSAASYHFFALVMDAGFLPFYVFTALLAKRNLDIDAGTSGRWRTFFPTDEDTDKVLMTEWLCAVTVAGLHCASLCLDVWLTLVFRKIASLPPDMNPLEDNLTSRRRTKHKHKNSSISAITPLTQVEKRYSGLSALSDNQSDPLMADRTIPSPERKHMSFMHTRGNSSMTYSPHTPKSAHETREWLAKPKVGSPIRLDINTRDDLLRRDEPQEQTLAQRREMLAQQAIKRSSRPASMHSLSSKYNNKDGQPPAPPPHQTDPSGDIGLQNDREDIGNNYWFVNDEPSATSRAQQSPPKPFFFPPKNSGYTSINAYDDVSDDELDQPLVPGPLRMNPPTPPPTQVLREPPVKATPPQQTATPIKRLETTSSISTESTYQQSPNRSPTKPRFYGDLKAAQQNIMGNTPPSTAPFKAGTPTYPSSVKNYTSNVSPSVQQPSHSSPFSLDRKNFPKVKKAPAPAQPTKTQSPRVVSRSGVDYEGRLYNDDLSDLGTPGRRRDVSGKIAEEGRGGGGLAERWANGEGLTYRKVSGIA